MTADQYRTAIQALELTQVGAAAFLDIDARTSRRYVLDELPVPRPIAMLLAVMVARRISVETVRKLMGEGDAGG